MSNLTGRPIYQKGSKPEVSKPVRNAARDAECTLKLPYVCDNRTDTVVFCHLRVFNLAGAGQKPGDGAGLNYELIFRALIKSQKRRREAGLIELKGTGSA
jgi:hypothetical protein